MQRTGSGRYWASVLSRLVLCLAVLKSCGEIAVSAQESEDASVSWLASKCTNDLFLENDKV